MSAAPRLRLAALLASAALLCGGCSLTAGRGGDITGSVGSAPMTEKAARAQLETETRDISAKARTAVLRGRRGIEAA